MSQTMLLTKPLTTFLSQNASPQLPSLLLTSPTGKLLSSSSPLPASSLRTQATIACTLWDLHQSSDTSNRVASALPQSTRQDASSSQGVSSITLQLSHGIMVIRSLSCGLLFVAIGPPISPPPSNGSQMLLPTHFTSSQTSPQASPPTHHEGHEGLGDRVVSGGSLAVGSGPSETASVGSSVAGVRAQASILGINRQAEEIGKWLEHSLRGLVLSTAEGR